MGKKNKKDKKAVRFRVMVSDAGMVILRGEDYGEEELHATYANSSAVESYLKGEMPELEGCTHFEITAR